MEKVVKLFGLDHVFPSLHSVFITTPYDDNSHLVGFLQNLARSCPSLRKIGLSRRKFPGIDLPAEFGVSVDHVTLRFLHRIQGLEEFRLEHAWPVFIHDEAVVDFISHLPRLRTLHLNPNPVYAILPLTTFQVLGMISERCPWVQDLALYLTPGNEGVHLETTEPTNVLRNLTKIRFGKTLVPDALRNQMMSYLSLVLPPSCDIITDSTEPLDGLPESVTTSTGFAGIHAFWKDVGAQWRNRRFANS
ncbi:hypothetical protein SCHPADRAFT_678606 [Schizopora paradoxa]|uniref:F-box domain-containing protein n=1 Tax=Schizopora paradoxa TaxID=27342 RepID=A0A0H2R4L7_9AGAM|nr:hypothetical protein SCHPADRAFT_678606 [Schizopora paradoxa]